MKQSQEKNEAAPARRSEKFRRRVLAQVRQQLAQGMALEVAAAEIGVEVETVTAWMSGDGASFVRVELAAGEVTGPGEGVEGGPIVELACGVRVHGLSVAGVAELARRLSCSA